MSDPELEPVLEEFDNDSALKMTYKSLSRVLIQTMSDIDCFYIIPMKNIKKAFKINNNKSSSKSTFYVYCDYLPPGKHELLVDIP